MSLESWSTPKRALQMENAEQFVALTPQDKTFIEAGKDADNLIESLGTPYHHSKKFHSKENQHNGIFHSLGISNKLKTIHQETDHIVKGMLSNGTGSFTNSRYAESPEEKDFHSPQDSKYSLRSPLQRLTPSQTSRCQDLFTAKDEIIQQKDIIMQKQKSIIMQLRERNMELEEHLIRKEQAQLKSANYEHFHQEHQHQIQKLKHEMNESYSRKCAEIEKLQRKLGEKEYELGKLAITLKENNFNKESMMEKIKKEFELNNQNLNIEREKSSSIMAELVSTRQENLKLQSYLEELPTSNEFKKIKHELKQIVQERDDFIESKDHIHKKYKDLKKEFLEKELDYKKMQRAMFGLKEDISCLTSTLEKYRTKAPISIEDHELKLKEITTLDNENRQLRESLSKRQKKMARLHYEYVAKRKESESEKEVFRETVKTLQDEINGKSVSITKINARNQELLSSSLQAQGELKKYKEMYNEEYQLLLSSLHAEITTCFDDLKSFVNLCTSMSKGNDPNLHSLLGFKVEDSPDKTKEPMRQDVDSLKGRLELVQDIRKQIDELRNSASEQYAEEIGKNMCVTQ